MLTRTLFCAIAFAGLVHTGHAEDAATWIKTDLDGLVTVYRHFHSHPELSFQEKKTAARMADELRELDIEVTTGVGGHGVVGLLKNGDGPIVMLRADMDALPVTEDTGLVYSSRERAKDPSGKEVGVMHACGHDVHMANLVGVARYLSAHKSGWRGTVMFVAQPAEEMGKGAIAMLDDGLFRRFPKPNFALMLHVDSKLATGRVSYRAGFATANVDNVDITIKGRGGHGAAPHTTIDPIVQAARLVLDLQTIVSREIKPTEPAVVTVGSIHGGTKHNIIGDQCKLQLTVRCYSDDVREQIHAAIQRKAKAVAMAAGAPEPTIERLKLSPSMLVDRKLAARLDPVFKRLAGSENVVESDATMGGEDFSRYGRAGVPILMYRLGSVSQRRLDRFKQLGQSPPSLHSPKYYPDIEETLETGVTTMAGAALELLKPTTSNGN